MLTAPQIRWAKQHDWFLADQGDGTILCVDRYTFKGELHEAVIVHSDFAELRNWAGY